ncbi:hypothetical protein F6Y03_30795 [Bacillus megaterium]|nr:hypothetical protein [Priestia megaterium]
MAQASQKQTDFIQNLLEERDITLEDIGFTEDWILEDENLGQPVASGIIQILLKLPKAE